MFWGLKKSNKPVRSLWRPRCSHASDSPGPAMVEFLSNPFIPCILRPKYLKTGGVYPPIRRAQCDRRGGPLGQAAKPRPKGCGPLPLPRGQAHPSILGGWWGHVVPNPQKSYLRLVWHQYVVGGGCGCTPVPRKKNGENGKTKFPTLLDRIFARPISPNWYAHPVFFAFIAKSTSNSTQKCEKKFSHFLDHPLEKKFFSGSANLQNHPNSGVFCFHLLNDAKRPKKRAHIYSKRS